VAAQVAGRGFMVFREEFELMAPVFVAAREAVHE
jgi:hypothetical protein